jgi:hypothetical protein
MFCTYSAILCSDLLLVAKANPALYRHTCRLHIDFVCSLPSFCLLSLGAFPSALMILRPDETLDFICFCFHQLPQVIFTQPALDGVSDSGVSISADRLVLTRETHGWLGNLLEPAIHSTRDRSYAEWIIEETGANSEIMIGVTDLDVIPPAGQYIYDMPGSRMFYCNNFLTYPAGRALGPSGRCKRGDRVGLLVERGSVSVYLNGARVGPGPMATDLPERVRRCCFQCVSIVVFNLFHETLIHDSRS